MTTCIAGRDMTSLASSQAADVVVVCASLASRRLAIVVGYVVASACIVNVRVVAARLLEFLVRQIKAGTISHVHFETARGEALRLRLLNARDLLLRMRHRAVMLLTVLLDKLVL